MSILQSVPPLRLTDLVAAEVRAEMARQQVTQVQLSRSIGMSQQSLSERLRGKTPFTTDDLEKVAGALRVHPARLLGGHGDGPQPPAGTTARYPDESDTLSVHSVALHAVASRASGLGWAPAIPDAA